MNSPWRDRPIAESLKLFDEMRRGMIEEGKATLRMKQDMQSDNFNMYDLIAYRIKVNTKYSSISIFDCLNLHTYLYIWELYISHFPSSLLIHMLGISGASIQVMITLTALWIPLRMSPIRYVPLLC